MTNHQSIWFVPRPSARRSLPDSPRRLLPLLVLLACVGCAKPAEPPEDEIDLVIHQAMTSQKIPALSLLVMRDGKVLKQKAYGSARLEPPIAATTETVFPVFSITKTFTAVGVLRLVEQGKFKLDDPIGGLLPDLPEAWKPITVRQLLGHTSGLPDLLSENKDFAYLSEDREEALRLAAKKSLVSLPGEESAYLQTGYVLLGKIVEKATGMAFADYMIREFFVPLGMTSTTYGNLRHAIQGRPSMYEGVRAEKGGGAAKTTGFKAVVLEKLETFDNPEYQVVGATLNTNTSDLIKWELALGGGKLLRPESMEAMWTMSPASKRTGGEWIVGMGLGWHIDNRSGHRSASFGGGSASHYVRYIEDKLTVVILTNLRGSNVTETEGQIVSVVAPDVARYSYYSRESHQPSPSQVGP